MSLRPIFFEGKVNYNQNSNHNYNNNNYNYIIIIIIITIIIMITIAILNYDCNSGRREWGEMTFRVGPEGWGPEGWGAQNFGLSFPFPITVSLSLCLSWVSSRGILVVFEAPECSNVHVWSSRAVV